MKNKWFSRSVLPMLLSAMATLTASAWANTESRLALLIGNASYKSSPLANPVNDVRLMEGALKEAGFTVIKAENASIRDMRRLVRDFGDKLKASGGVGLFYFAGHGVQVRGENFLVSTDSDIRNEDEVADDALNANVILEKMQTAGNRMNLVILDACRNNPFAVKSRSAPSGLATMSAPSGSLVAYSTAPGSVASDGSGRNGLYTEFLAKVIRQPGLPVEEVFKQVRSSVRKASNNQQTPWENTALEGQFFFKAPAQVAALAPTVLHSPQSTSSDPVAVDMAFWDSVKTSQRTSDFQAYLSKFPDGVFAALAKTRLDDLGSIQKGIQPMPSLPAKTEAVSNVATLFLTDTISGQKSKLFITREPAADGLIAYSTGDVITKDGSIVQLSVGNVVMRLDSGDLWTYPLKAGLQGEARMHRLDDAMSKNSLITWRTRSGADQSVVVEAKVSYRIAGRFNLSAYGDWTATYSSGRHLPDSTTTLIRESISQMHNMVSSRIVTH
jgi:hypothetical protein